jgi:hypothetical protein
MYIVDKIMTLNSGLITLTEAQYLRRKTQLEELGGGVYNILAPVEFKRGEVIGLQNGDRYIETHAYPLRKEEPTALPKQALPEQDSKKGKKK